MNNMRKPSLLIAAVVAGACIFLIPEFFFIALFIALGALSTIYKSHFNIGLDLELQSAFTIAAAVFFGPVAGGVVGFFSVFFGHAINLMFMGNPILSLVYAVSFCFLGIIAGHIPFGSLLLFCMIYIIANDVLFILLGTMLGANPGRLMFAAVIHPIFVFIVLARVLLPVLSIFRGAR